MGKNVLISKSAEEIKAQLEASINILKELVAEKETDDEEKAEWIESIKKNENQLSEVYEERWFLVDKTDESKIIIDFWDKYSSNEVEEVIETDLQFISVTYDDSEKDNIMRLINYEGRTIIESCQDYCFIGKKKEYLVIEQLGYMLNKHWHEDNNRFFSILGSNSIQEVQEIYYLSEFNIIRVNSDFLYADKENYIGKILLQDDDYIIYENEEEFNGFIYGEFISEAKYSFLKYLGYGLFQYRTEELCGFIHVDDNVIVYDKNMISENSKLIWTKSEEDPCLVFHKDKKSFLSIYNSEINEWSDFSFDNVLEVKSEFVLNTILIGTDIKDNKTTIFVFNDGPFGLQSEPGSSEQDIYILYTIEGVDPKSIYENLFVLKQH
jgi:hypothetical protein